MQIQSLEKLFVHELKDLYSAENQILEALPKMKEAASSDDLKNGFEEHRKQTEEHVKRIEQIFEDLDQKPSGETCKGMEGLIAEGEMFVKADGDSSAKDAGLISAAQKVEHYEIASYGAVRTYAQHLGNNKAKDLLEKTLKEESQTDEKLTHLAEKGAHINEMAMR